jgi:hypothetical protein
MFTFFPKMDVGKKSHVNMQHLFLMHRPHEGERRRSTPSLAGAWNPRPVAWLLGDVPAGCREVELVGWEGATLASQTKEGGRECVLFIGTNSVTSTPQWIRQPVEGRAEDRGERQGDVTKEHERGRCLWRCWN